MLNATPKSSNLVNSRLNSCLYPSVERKASSALRLASPDRTEFVSDADAPFELVRTIVVSLGWGLSLRAKISGTPGGFMDEREPKYYEEDSREDDRTAQVDSILGALLPQSYRMGVGPIHALL